MDQREKSKDKAHLLTLKVMRLTRPTSLQTHAAALDGVDCLKSSASNPFVDSWIDTSLDDSDKNYLSPMLLLPQSFGNIFLGEGFYCYICVHNSAEEDVAVNVGIKSELQTSSAPSGVVPEAFVAELRPGQSFDRVVHYDMREVGTHVLACTVTYENTLREKFSFRKFFKFVVMKPLDVKTKFYNAESDEVYLEAQLINLTGSPIFLQKVSLEPSSLYTVRSLNAVEGADEDEDEAALVDYLEPNCARQFLYCLKPCPTAKESTPEAFRGPLAVGKLDILWRSHMGERGRLQTSQLQRVGHATGDLKVSVEELPGMVTVSEPFTVRCSVTNMSAKDIELEVRLVSPASKSLAWIGLSGYKLGTIRPKESRPIDLQLAALSSGFQAISGLRLVDLFGRKTYEFDDLAQVYVSLNDIHPSPA